MHTHTQNTTCEETLERQGLNRINIPSMHENVRRGCTVLIVHACAYGSSSFMDMKQYNVNRRVELSGLGPGKVIMLTTL